MPPPQDNRHLQRIGIFFVVFALVQAICLFGPAGTLHWPIAWAYLAISAGFVVVCVLTVEPDLLRDRSSRNSGHKRWDPWLTSFGFILFCPVVLVVAGYDVKRFGWSIPIPTAVSVAGLVIFVLGQSFALRAMVVNRFFVKFVRIQSERGHHVINTGPYACVRHPGYAGAIVAHLALPVALGSLWALIPACLGCLLFVVRTALEDRTLQAELPGYKDYANQVRWRLVPGVW